MAFTYKQKHASLHLPLQTFTDTSTHMGVCVAGGGFKKQKLIWAWWGMRVITVLGRQRHEELKFKVILSYAASFRQSWIHDTLLPKTAEAEENTL